jgi:MFS family permease
VAATGQRRRAASVPRVAVPTAPASDPLPASALPLTRDARLEVTPAGAHRVHYRPAVPYFWWMWAWQVRRRARAIEAAADAGRPIPARTPWWAPPVPMEPATYAALAALCLLGLVTSYGGGVGGLLTQSLPYAAKVFDVGDQALATGLAVVRAGLVGALLITWLADRRGRRGFVIGATVAHGALAGILGLAPTFVLYIAGHLALRAIDVALGIVIVVLAAELVPAANRALVLAMMALANGAGSALAVVVLPLAAAGRTGFAAAYALNLAAIPLAIVVGRRLRESRRYLDHVAEPHGYREVLRPPYRGRLVLLGVPLFLAAPFYAPALEFINRYLEDERGFGSVTLVAFLAVTALPGAAGLVAGGRAADWFGRRRVGIPFLAASSIGYAVFYVVDGPWLWPAALVGFVCGAVGISALSVYGPELFPTRIRSSANAVLLVVGVLGGGAGLLIVGALSDTLGLGPAIAVLVAGPLLAMVFAWLRFPETARRELETTSGESE